MLAALLALTALSPAAARVQEPAAEADLGALLAAAVDESTPAARRKAADALVKRRGLTVDDWLAVTRAFGDFAPAEPGVRVETLSFPIEGEKEETTVRVYVPSSYDPGTPTPLVFALHGAGGSGRGMIANWRALAEEHGLLVLAPDEAGRNEGYRFEERERSSAMAALRWMRRNYNVDEDAVHLHGISRGGHMAWDLGVRYPDRWATVSPAIGAPTFTVSEGRNNLRLVENLRDVPLRQLQGMQDDPKLIRNLELAFARLETVGAADAEFVRFPELGHTFRMDGIDWGAFLALRRTPVPDRMLLRSARLDKARVAWAKLDRFTRGEVDETFPIQVDPRKWDSWEFGQKADYIQEQADARTAQLDARWEEGVLVISGSGVDRVFLMLPPERIVDGEVRVRVGDKERTLKAKPSKRVLLRDFVERFDRRVLPVAEVKLSL